jgi:hypothetical protein
MSKFLIAFSFEPRSQGRVVSALSLLFPSFKQELTIRLSQECKSSLHGTCISIWFAAYVPAFSRKT